MRRVFKILVNNRASREQPLKWEILMKRHNYELPKRLFRDRKAQSQPNQTQVLRPLVMKKQIRFSSVHLLAIFLVALLSASVQAQYTFGPQVQSTPSASITYDSGTDAFQYTDAANLSDDRTYLPLSGTAATFLTVSNGWTASFTVNISTRSMTQSNGNNPVIGITLAIVSQNGPNIFSQSVRMTLSQKSDTGANNLNYPPGFYGTAAQFIALTNGSNDVTTPLGTSVYLNGGSFLFLSGGMNASST